MLAPFGPWEEVELAAAVCNGGGLGSLGTAVRSTAELRAQWRRLRDLTDRPFAINHTGRPFNEEAFAATLELAPAAISFHMGVPADLIARAHDRGIRWMQTVSDPDAAEVAVAAGADVLVAQGHEAGGNGGWTATMVLVPSVVDVAGDVPVVAAGGIADGRGIAAAFALGAAGAILGTRFLATTEMAIDPSWKARIVAAARDRCGQGAPRRAGDATVHAAPARRPTRPGAADAAGRPARDRPGQRRPRRGRSCARRRRRAGGGHDLLPFTGQSAALVHDIVPAAELMARLVARPPSPYDPQRRRTSLLDAHDPPGGAAARDVAAVLERGRCPAGRIVPGESHRHELAAVAQLVRGSVTSFQRGAEAIVCAKCFEIRRAFNSSEKRPRPRFWVITRSKRSPLPDAARRQREDGA